MSDPEPHDEMSRPHELCALERKCLALTANGIEANDVGQKLGLTTKEVEVLLYCAQRKLGATNLMQALARYLADESTGTIGI